jgi:uncharacterized protein (TIGR04255 family)
MAQNQAPFAPGLQQQPNSGFPGLMPGVQLDFDCYRSSTYAVSELPALLDEAHDIIDKAFFGMITEEYLAYLKGSP